MAVIVQLAVDQLAARAHGLDRLRSQRHELHAAYRGEVARRWRYRDGSGEIGMIASVTQPFCGDCTRARVSAEGRLYTCLFAMRGHDLRALIRGGADDAYHSIILPFLSCPFQ